MTPRGGSRVCVLRPPRWAGELAAAVRRAGVELGSLARRLVQPGATTVRLGVSGGADSLGLSVLFAALGYRVVAIHVDHGARPESAAEGSLLASMLWRFGISVVERRVVVRQGPNFEARARRARLRALEGAATAHTMDDQAETVLINLLRGAGLVGIGAMEPGPRHPALALRRAELVAVVRAAGLVPLRDPMNDDARFVRVRVRRELLPLASAIAHRDVVPLLARAAEHAREAASIFAANPEVAPMTLALAEWVESVTGLRLSQAHRRALVEVARGTRGAHVLPGALCVRRVKSWLVLSSKGQEIARLGL